MKGCIWRRGSLRRQMRALGRSMEPGPGLPSESETSAVVPMEALSFLQPSSPRSRVRWLLQRGQLFFFMTGLAALLAAAFVYAEMPIYQFFANARLARMQKESKNRPLSPGSLIGRVQVSRIGLSTVLLEGTDSRNLRLAAGHIRGTALPGEPGNVGVAGHRDTFFRNLQKIRDNDIITLTTPRGPYRYRVDTVEIVEPDDVDVLDGFSSERRLTLVTCYPFRWVGSAPHRFVVSAREVSAP